MNKAANDALRKEWFSKIAEAIHALDVDEVRTGTATLAIPCVDIDGEDAWVEVYVKVPIGSKDEPYDGYAHAEEFRIKEAERAEKARIAAEKKAKKIAKDEAERAARKAAKEKHEREKGA